MDEYWEQSGETVTIQQSYQPPQQHSQEQQEDEFDFSSTQQNYGSAAISQQSYMPAQSHNFESGPQSLEYDQISRQIRQEEERINQQLQQRGNQEYELKQKRKQEGRRWLEEFFSKKQQQTIQRKQNNIKHQQQLLHDMKNAQTSQGWTKVAKSVDLKQSDYKGSKEIHRMREAILHKKEDEAQL